MFRNMNSNLNIHAESCELAEEQFDFVGGRSINQTIGRIVNGVMNAIGSGLFLLGGGRL